MTSYDHNTTPLEMVVRDARLHQREMAKHGIEAGVQKAQQKIDDTLDELNVRYALKQYRAQD
ncbi:hypothetical protein ACFXKC_30180 [Streptomyces sp. NPDC059340]|uniref:hypothetical protein n=1 Tax=Streptomyces sp. NPDC059340 TaxID=3346806 RepID=UPI0036A6AA5A